MTRVHFFSLRRRSAFSELVAQTALLKSDPSRVAVFKIFYSLVNRRNPFPAMRQAASHLPTKLML